MKKTVAYFLFTVGFLAGACLFLQKIFMLIVHEKTDQAFLALIAGVLLFWGARIIHKGLGSWFDESDTSES